MSSARTRQTQQRASTASSATSRRSKSPDILPSEQPGLRRIVQQRLLKDVFESTSCKLHDMFCFYVTFSITVLKFLFVTIHQPKTPVGKY